MLQEIVEFAGFDFLATTFVDVECEVKEFGDVLSGDGAGENQGRVEGEFEVVADFRCECVAGVGVFAFDGVPFADDEDRHCLLRR